VARNLETFLAAKAHVELGLERRAKGRFLCECGAGTCAEVIAAPLHVYEGVRLDSRRFLVALGHGQPEAESILEETGGYVIVETGGRQ
jgi:hypothetical protein